MGHLEEPQQDGFRLSINQPVASILQAAKEHLELWLHRARRPTPLEDWWSGLEWR